MSTYVYLQSHGAYVKDNQYYRFGKIDGWVPYRGHILVDFPNHNSVPDTALILQGVPL